LNAIFIADKVEFRYFVTVRATFFRKINYTKQWQKI